MKKLLSIVVSCYNEELAIPLFYKEVKKMIEKMDYLDFEIVFVDDGSKDKTLEILKKLAKKDKQVKYVVFLEILVKRLLCMQDLSIQKEIM